MRSVTAAPVRDVRAYVARSAGVCMVGLVLNQALGQAGGAILARIIPNAHLYGELALLLQYLNLGALGLGIGLDSALVYDLATGRPGGARSFSLAWRGMVLLAAAPALACLLAAPLIGRAYGMAGFPTAVALGGAALIAQAALNAAIAAQSGMRRFWTQMALMVAATALAATGRVAAVAAVTAGASLGIVALCGAGGVALVAVLALGIGARLPFAPAADPAPGTVAELRRMLRYGWPLWAGNLLKAFQQPYLALIAGAGGITAAGLVSNDVTLLGWPFLVTWAFRIVAVPLVAGGGDASERRARLTICFRLNHLVLLPVVAAFVFWARPLVVALYGARYAGGAVLLPLLTLGVYGSSVGRLATDALAAVDRTKESIPIMLITSVPLLLLAPVAAHRLVWLGIVYCAGWLGSAAYAYLLLHRVGLGPDPRTGFAEPLLPTACALPLALLGTRLGGSAGLGCWLLAGLVLLAASAAVYRAGATTISAAGTVGRRPGRAAGV